MRTSSAAQRRLQGLVYEALSYERMRPLPTSVCGLKEYENKLRRSEAHVCVCVYVCVYTYIYICNYTLHILMHIHICSCIHRFVDVQLPFVRVRVCVFGACARVVRPLRLREFACCISVTYTADSARTHTLTPFPPHTNTHARTRAHTQTHTCPCTQRCLLFDAVFF